MESQLAALRRLKAQNGNTQPPKKRGGIMGVYDKITHSRAYRQLSSLTLQVGGKVKDWGWIVGSTAALLLLPVLLEIQREGQFQLMKEEHERAVKEAFDQASQAKR